jgi:ApbE superfamily uncharacterized protein (UPF0280 family)
MSSESDGDPDMSEFVLAKAEIEETSATIAAEREFLPAAVEAIRSTRSQIERQIRHDRFFLTTLEPYEPDPSSARVIRRMCAASSTAGVGPMATVAGVVAQEALEAMVSKGCRHGWVDNGGDIALIIQEPATVEIFSDPGSKDAYALELEPTDEIIGVCTSSGTLGHSISFGNADVALAVADDAVLADALATAIGNGVEDKESLDTCFDRFKRIDGFRAGLAMIDGKVSMHGRIPRIVEVEHNPERLTTHGKMSSSRFTGTDSLGTEVRI